MGKTKKSDRKAMRRKEMLKKIREAAHGADKDAAKSSRFVAAAQGDSAIEGSKKYQDDFDIVPVKKWLFYEFDFVREHLSWTQPRRIGAGLYNLGNTCFLNATMYCLAHTPLLAQYCLRRAQDTEAEADLELHLARTIAKMLTSTAPIEPSRITKRLRSIGKQFRLGRQEDSHEFLRCLLEGTHLCQLRRAGVEETAKRRRAETTAVHAIFGGYLRSQIRCAVCGYNSNTYDSFLDLSVELSKGVRSVDDALRHFATPEILDKDNLYKCDKCGKKSQARKYITMRYPPNVLTIQLKRFAFGGLLGGKRGGRGGGGGRFNGGGGSWGSGRGGGRFRGQGSSGGYGAAGGGGGGRRFGGGGKPKKKKGGRGGMGMGSMGMLEMMMMGGMGFGGGGGRKINSHIGFPEDLDISPALSEESLAEGQPTKYLLHGVLVHSGSSAQSGHYFSYVRGPAGGWYLCDDSHVARVDLKQVLNQRAYMLFYTRTAKGEVYPGPVHVHQEAKVGAAPGVLESPGGPSLAAVSADALGEALRLDPAAAKLAEARKAEQYRMERQGGEVPGILGMAGAVSPSGRDKPEALAAVRRPRAESWTSDSGEVGSSAGGAGITASSSSNARVVLYTVMEEDGLGAEPEEPGARGSVSDGVAEELKGFGGDVWAGLYDHGDDRSGEGAIRPTVSGLSAWSSKAEASKFEPTGNTSAASGNSEPAGWSWKSGPLPSAALTDQTCEGGRGHLYLQPLWRALSTREAALGASASQEQLFEHVKLAVDEDSRLDRALGAGPPMLWRPPPSAGGSMGMNWRPRGWSRVRRATQEEVTFLEAMGMLDWMHEGAACDDDSGADTEDDDDEQQDDGETEKLPGAAYGSAEDSSDDDDEERRASDAVQALASGDDFLSRFVAGVKSGEIADECEGTHARRVPGSGKASGEEYNSSDEELSSAESDGEVSIPSTLRGWTVVQLPKHLRCFGVVLSRKAGCKTGKKRGMAILRSGKEVTVDELPVDPLAPEGFWDPVDDEDESDDEEAGASPNEAEEVEDELPFPELVEKLRVVRRQLSVKIREGERAERLRRQRYIAGLPQDFEFNDLGGDEGESYSPSSGGSGSALSSLWDDAAAGGGKEFKFDWASVGSGDTAGSPPVAAAPSDGSSSDSSDSSPSDTSPVFQGSELSRRPATPGVALKKTGAGASSSSSRGNTSASRTVAKRFVRRALSGGGETVVVHKRGGGVGGDGGSDAESDDGGKASGDPTDRRVRWSQSVAGGAGSPGDLEVNVRSVLHGGPLAGRQATPGFKKGYWGADEAGGWEDSEDEDSDSGSSGRASASRGPTYGDLGIGQKRGRVGVEGSAAGSLELRGEHSGRNPEEDDWENLLDEGRQKKVMEASREERWQETKQHAGRFDDVAKYKAKKRRAEAELRGGQGEDDRAEESRRPGFEGRGGARGGFGGRGRMDSRGRGRGGSRGGFRGGGRGGRDSPRGRGGGFRGRGGGFRGRGGGGFRGRGGGRDGRGGFRGRGSGGFRGRGEGRGRGRGMGGRY